MKAITYNRILLALGFIGLFIAGFLSIAHVMNASVPCGRNFGCNVVTNDPQYSVFMGIPVAYMGLLGYLVLTVLALVRAMSGLEKTKSLIMPGYFIAAIGTLESLYLQYVSLTKIMALCPWCMASAITMVVTLIVYALLAQHVDEAPVEALKADNAGFRMATVLGAILILALGISGYVLKNQSHLPQTIGGKSIEELNANYQLIPKDAHVFGDRNAPITILEFADMQCPACRRTTPRVEEFINQHPGKIRLVYRHFPLVEKHPLALPAALMSEAAADKGKFYDFLLAVMKSGGDEDLGIDALYTVARTVGLERSEIEKRINDTKDPIYEKVHRDMNEADRLGLQVTPTLFLLMNGKLKFIASSNDVFEALQKSPFKEILDDKAQP